MAQCSMTITVKVAWWVRPYIHACAVFADLFGVEPDCEKITRTCMRGIKVYPDGAGAIRRFIGNYRNGRNANGYTVAKSLRLAWACYRRWR